MNEPAPEVSRAEIPCLNLRSKGMYHGSDEDDGMFWCCNTQESFGPDGAPTGKTECCKGRACYVG
jgi:hypothetical protein